MTFLRGCCALALFTSALGATSAPASDPPPVSRLVSRIDVKNFGAEQLRIGDLDGDGAPDLLLVQSKFMTREITCLTAITIDGKVLWQHGEPSTENGIIQSDLPVQVYDWDNDGWNDVLYIRQAKYLDPYDGKKQRLRSSKYEGNATMMILNGQTGKEKSTLKLPPAADDSFAFADFTGKGRREDLVVKDRYWNAWGISHEGKELWHWFGSTGHYPAVGDVTGDGLDEVFFGFALVRHDGKVLFNNDPNKWRPGRFQVPAHSDASCIVKLASGKVILPFGNHGAHCMDLNGKDMWDTSATGMGEAQHLVPGRFRSDSELQFVSIDRTPDKSLKKNRDESAADLYLLDMNGKPIWKQTQKKGDWVIACTSVNWFGGDNLKNILLFGKSDGQPAEILDGDGKVVCSLPMLYLPEISEADRQWAAQHSNAFTAENFYAHTADVWGDEREEVILFGSRGLCIYTNPRPVAIPTLYNETLYTGQ